MDNSFGDIFYGISERWLKLWRAFVNGESHKVPGAIDNSDISMPKQVSSNQNMRRVNAAVW